MADIANIMEGMYVPEASNNALFDAFYVDEQRRLHLPGDGQSGSRHCPGFATVAEIRAKVERARPGKRVDVKYVLVVPLEEKWAVRWNMADELKRRRRRSVLHTIPPCQGSARRCGSGRHRSASVQYCLLGGHRYADHQSKAAATRYVAHTPATKRGRYECIMRIIYVAARDEDTVIGAPYDSSDEGF